MKVHVVVKLNIIEGVVRWGTILFDLQGPRIGHWVQLLVDDVNDNCKGMSPNEYLSNGIPEQPRLTCLFYLRSYHIPNLLVEYVAQQTIGQEPPRISRKHLIVCMYSVVNPTCTKD